MYKTDKIYLYTHWDIPIAFHPTDTGKILINIPGAGGSVTGYQNKYINLGNFIQKKNLASFVRIPNDKPQEFNLTSQKVINYSLENSKQICGSDKPEIWLMAFSAGGASVLITGWEYPEVTKILLVNPFIEPIRDKLKRDLPEYKGELFVVVGENDRTIGKDTVDFIRTNLTNVSDFQAFTIPDCDHQLKGEKNSRILSQLPEYYFMGKYRKEKFPNENDGIDLLDP